MLARKPSSATELQLGLAEVAGHGPAEAIETGIRPPQERLGLSRQTTTALVRDLMTAGVVHWRYGLVTLLDVQALQALTPAPPNGS